MVHAAEKETHDKRLRQVLERMKAVNLTLNWEKCEIGLTELAFFGYLVSEKGIGPTEERVRAVIEARQSENMHELRSFLGLVNYSARFIPGFATISEPLRKLTRKHVPFVFGREQCTAFSVLKRKLTNAIKLVHFDKEAPTQVIPDASPVLASGIDGGGPGSRTITWSCRCELRQPQSIRRRASLLPNRKGSYRTGMGM